MNNTHSRSHIHARMRDREREWVLSLSLSLFSTLTMRSANHCWYRNCGRSSLSVSLGRLFDCVVFLFLFLYQTKHILDALKPRTCMCSIICSSRNTSHIRWWGMGGWWTEDLTGSHLYLVSIFMDKSLDGKWHLKRVPCYLITSPFIRFPF